LSSEVANAEEGRQSLLDGGYLFPSKFTEYTADPPFVD
jgi:hypothetical protein